jgi:heme A synthase
MLLHAHSGLRYLVLLAGLVVIAYAAYCMVTKRDYDKRIRVLSAIFTGLMDLTVMLGIATLFVGQFYPQLGGHIVTMVFATVVAHVVYGVMKRRPAEKQTYAPHLVGTLIVLGLIAAGILSIGRPIVG